MESTPTRDQALALLREFNENESLIKHALAVEAVMRHMARKAGEDEEEWGVIGLIHDLDYEKFPDQHCAKTREILEERGWPAAWVRAVLSHGWTICTDVEPQTRLEKPRSPSTNSPASSPPPPSSGRRGASTISQSSP